MELENVETLKNLIKERDVLLKDLDSIKIPSTFPPKHIVFEWESGHTLSITVPSGKYVTIITFLEDLFNKELDKIEDSILKL